MILIIIPVKNEAKTLWHSATEIAKFCEAAFRDYRIVFIDDRSTDETWDILLALDIKNKLTIRNRFDNGKGSALKTGYVIANSTVPLEDTDYIIFLDGDGQINPKEIQTFFRLRNLYDADAVIGNKRHRYSHSLYGTTRRIISLSYNIFIRVLFGLNYQDTQCGLKLFRKSALDKVISNVNVKRYAFDLELIVALKEMGFRIVDAPVFIAQQVNRGSVSVRNIIQTFIDTMIVWIKKNKGHYRKGDAWQK